MPEAFIVFDHSYIGNDVSNSVPGMNIGMSRMFVVQCRKKDPLLA
jgi:hypothetical protein